VASEFVGAELGDARRTKRLIRIAEAVSAAPDRSIPQIARSDAELQGLYRFAENDAIQFRNILEPHFRATGERAQESSVALVIHDITELSYPLEEHRREGCGLLGMSQGFRLAPALVLRGDGSNLPLGLLNACTWIVEASRKKRPGKKKRGNTWGRTEYTKWLEFIDQAEQVEHGTTRFVHVADREAGTYGLFGGLCAASRGFVVRLMKNRLVELESDPGELVEITEVAARLESVLKFQVPLTRRKAKYLKQGNGPRNAREARLTVSAVGVRLHRPHSQAKHLPRNVELNLVIVKEANPPKGEQPVEWLLATSEPIATTHDVQRVVDFYRARWTIEEFFKALKTGCHADEVQLDSLAAIERMLAIYLVVTWRILQARQCARETPSAPATTIFSELEIMLLRADGRRPMPRNATLRHALLAVAAMGGHIKNNGEPGWLVLSRGMGSLMNRVVGAAQALELVRLGKM
jgi:hypothetical protein